MVLATKENINLFNADILRLGNEEPDIEEQDDIDRTEHVHGIEAFVGQEDGEHLLEADVGDVSDVGYVAWD